jgi:predicted nucleic acid-binding protein
LSIYLDASVAVSLVTEEPNSNALLQWWAGIGVGVLTISPWVTAEVISGLSLKVRMKEIDLAQRAQAQMTWNDYRVHDFGAVAIENEDFSVAAQLCVDPDHKLRAADALHLAIAKRAGLRVATLDRTMLSAALALGIRAFSPLEDRPQ